MSVTIVGDNCRKWCIYGFDEMRKEIKFSVWRMAKHSKVKLTMLQHRRAVFQCYIPIMDGCGNCGNWCSTGSKLFAKLLAATEYLTIATVLYWLSFHIEL